MGAGRRDWAALEKPEGGWGAAAAWERLGGEARVLEARAGAGGSLGQEGGGQGALLGPQLSSIGRVPRTLPWPWGAPRVSWLLGTWAQLTLVPKLVRLSCPLRTLAAGGLPGP